MEYRILGPLEVVEDGKPIDVGPRKQRSLLALLLINANRVVSTQRILESLWSEDAAERENTLWVYISKLRSALEPGRTARSQSEVLVTKDHGYVLHAEPEKVDALRFEAQANEASDLLIDQPDAASALLDEALAMWRGGALEEFLYEEWAQSETRRLEELRAAASEDRFEALIRSGSHREAANGLTAFVMENPLRERPVQLLMMALYRSGRQADALRAFDQYRTRIGEELGIEPSSELRRLEEQVLLQDPRLESRGAARAGITTDVPTSKNPFRGLQAFKETDVDVFFGRDRMTSELLRRVQSDSRLLAIVGASGSGKSSVIRAGLLTSLRKGAVEGSDEWLIAQMVPGSRPTAELEAALLRSTLDAPDSVSELLDDEEHGLLRAALRLLPGGEGRIVLVVDQFEELFTLVESEAVRERFVRNLEVAVDDPHGRVMVAIGIRADFYHRILAYPRFAELIGEGVVNTVPLTPNELEAAAEQPAAVAGVEIRPALVAHLLSDVAGQSGALPMFQFALTELFERRTDNQLTVEAYEQMGGVKEALARRAEEIFQELTTSEQEAAQQLFLRLVTISVLDWTPSRCSVSSTSSDHTGFSPSIVTSSAGHRRSKWPTRHCSASGPVWSSGSRRGETMSSSTPCLPSR